MTDMNTPCTQISFIARLNQEQYRREERLTITYTITANTRCIFWAFHMHSIFLLQFYNQQNDLYRIVLELRLPLYEVVVYRLDNVRFRAFSLAFLQGKEAIS